ncbi:MAG: hypothetical protein ORN21_01260 [Methylophilaceae bacterium]|nr:hypothetical protein [Methylophilaceae bacterium]
MIYEAPVFCMSETHRVRERLQNRLRGRIEALRGARNLAVYLILSRFLRAVRLALHPARLVLQEFLR